ncbi:oxygenase MpaB family protein [Salinicola avicenniae]|uniref:oxygenase MpaB family protein n=1 Tax=Salinicola avicenniae TaxID=2916836 RepID=UPI002072A64B|nr:MULTISPECIES: oxygenase MpaB family protein [unclassified Salinicola]
MTPTRLRDAIEQRISHLTGRTLGGVDYTQPKGDPGLFGPETVAWRIHGDFTSMMCGGISALLLQMLHPLALAGVWDHSNFRQDMIGRLRRTSQFIAVTTFGSREDAERILQRVRQVHEGVVGEAADGTPYAASDPELLTWVHVAEMSRFLAAHRRYRNPRLSLADQDRYFDETARVAEALGARDVPRSRAAVDAYLERQRRFLVCDTRTRDVVEVLLHSLPPSPIIQPAGALFMRAGIDLLPPWAATLLGLEMSARERRAVRGGIRTLAPVVRWAVRNGSYRRAMERMQAKEQSTRRDG